MFVLWELSLIQNPWKLLFKSNPLETENKIPFFLFLCWKQIFRLFTMQLNEICNLVGEQKYNIYNILNIERKWHEKRFVQIISQAKVLFLFFFCFFPSIAFYTSVLLSLKEQEKNKGKLNILPWKKNCGKKSKNRTFKTTTTRIVLNFLLIFFC